MKRVRWPILIALFAALFVAVAWQRAKNDMPIEFLDGAPKVSYISREALEAKPKIDFKIFGKRIRYPEPIENILLPSDIETGPGYLDFRGTVNRGSIHLEDAAGTRIYGSIAYPLGPIAGNPKPISTADISFDIRTSSRSEDSSRLIGFPFATDERYRRANLVVVDRRYPVRLPVSAAFGPSQRRATAVTFGSWKMTIQPKPWRYSTATFDVDVRIEGPEATFLFPKNLQPNGTLEIAKVGESRIQRVPYLPESQASRAEILRVAEEDAEIIVGRTGYTFYHLKLASGEIVFDSLSGIPWDNKSIVALKCLNILAFHSSGFSEVDSKQKLDTLKDGDRVKGTIYRVLERFRVDIPVDIPPLLTKPFMRDR